MKNGRFKSLLLFWVILFVISCTAPASTKLAPQAFLDQIKNEGGRYMILDVRTREEINQGKIPGATQINFYDEDFSDRLNEMDKKNIAYYVYCAAGGRSGKAASLMSEMGFKKVYDLKGGMNAWKAAGLEVN